MGTSSGGEAATPVMTGVPEVTATISGLTNGTTYFYVVKATNAAGSSPASNEASATPVPPPHPPPPAPANVSAVAASGQVTLSWAASAGATSYSVYMGTSAGGESSTAARAGITGLSTTITGLTNGTTYYYTVKAVDAGGTSAASNETSATPTAPPQPPTPTPTPTGSGGGGGFDVISLLLLATGAALRGSRSARRSLLPVPASK
jgi:predicted phage tail protein